jgi:OmpA-OmpF porin, OOP family
MAQKVLFTEADLQAARDIQAGNAPIETQEQQLSAQQQKLKQQEQQLGQKEQQNQAAAQEAQQSANLANQRISDLNKYTTKDSATVYFGSDKTAVPPDAKAGLDKLASEALATNAYMIQIAGYASKTGSAQLNEELSNERADSVIAYLTQSGHIPIFRILAPAAMGASTQAGSDPALNRRVVVKVVVNEGIAQ